MSFMPSARSFRFSIGSKNYAVDIQNEGLVYFTAGLHLFFETGSGWHRAHVEMEPFFTVDQSAIDAAGGIVNLCRILTEKLNRALRLIQGDSSSVPDGTLPHEKVMDHLRHHLSLTYVDGVGQLVLRDRA